MKRETLHPGVAKRPTTKRPLRQKKRNPPTREYLKILAKVVEQAAVLIPDQHLESSSVNPLRMFMDETFTVRAIFEAEASALSMLLPRLNDEEWAVLEEAGEEGHESRLETMVRELEGLSADCQSNANYTNTHIHRHKAVFPFVGHD